MAMVLSLHPLPMLPMSAALPTESFHGYSQLCRGMPEYVQLH